MTENGGGRDFGDGTADSWFRPTENRYRTQSEYQDPEEEPGEGDEHEQQSDETVFPDSGGYAGLSTSRPAMVEPYPEALAGPPPGATESSTPGLASGAAPSAYEGRSAMPEDYESAGYPGVAASAQVPLPPEESARRSSDPWSAAAWPDSTRQDSTSEPWSRDLPDLGTSGAGEARPLEGENQAASADPWAPGASAGGAADWGARVPGAEPWRPTDAFSENAAPSWTPEPGGPGDADIPRSDRSWESSASLSGWGAGTYPSGSDARDGGTYSSGWGGWSPDGGDPARPGTGQGQDASAGSAPWTPTQTTGWQGPEPDDGSRLEGAGEPWRPTEASPGGTAPWDTGSAVDGPGAWSPGAPSAEPWRSADPAPGESGQDWRPRLEDSGSEAPRAWEPTGDYGASWSPAGPSEPWSDGYDDELSPSPPPLSSPPPAPQESPGGLGTGSGNTWAFDRNDPRLPDAVREAERRRRESAAQPPQYSDWGGPGDPAAGGPSTSVPSLDDPLAAIADMQSRERERDEQGTDFSDQREPGTDWQGPDGATQMFDASATRDPFPAQPPAAPGVGGTYDAAAGYSVGGTYGEERDRGGAPWQEQGYDAAHGYPSSADPGADGGATQMFAPPSFEGARGPSAPSGLPSDLGPVPAYGEHPAYGEQYEGAEPGDRAWDEEQGSPESHEVYEEPEYEDGFTPADYGMPEGSARSRRRRTDRKSVV